MFQRYDKVTPTYFKAARLAVGDLLEVIERFEPDSEIFPVLEKEISDEEFEIILKDKFKEILQEMLRKAFRHSIDINNR
jgi:hypothetical protein